LTSGSWSVPVKGEFTPSTFIGMYNMAGTNTTDKLVYPMVNNVYPECLVSVPLIAQEIEVGLMWVGRYDSTPSTDVYFGTSTTAGKYNPRFMTIMLEFTPISS
jgi:hypothetical protein